jgi:hemolysin III
MCNRCREPRRRCDGGITIAPTGSTARVGATTADAARARRRTVGVVITSVPTKPVLRGWSHVVAFAACSVLVVFVVLSADGGTARLAVSVYATGILAMLGVSSLYHRCRWGERAHAIVSRLDHSAIYLAIAGTYTPVAVLTLDGWTRVAILVIAWSGAVVGSSLIWIPLRVPRVWFVALYTVVGWAALVALPQLFAGLGATGFGLVIGGGVAYTVGAVVYGLRRPDPWPRVFGFHEVFHVCTLVGVGTHLAAIGLVVVPRA